MKKYKICSWNINGLRAVLKNGLLEWLERENNKWDIICFQEIKIQEHQLPEQILHHPDYNLYCAHAKRPGYSGVAMLIRKDLEISEVIEGVGIDQFDDEGRSLEVITKDFILINSYYPNGQRDHARVPYKLAFSEEILQRALDYKKLNRPVILAGDFNTAHHPIDLKNPKTNTKTTGFLPIERQWIDRLIDNGFIDLFRHQHPKQEGHYTWWTYRNNCRQRNIGWRIDYFFINEEFLQKVIHSDILSHVTGSDHCPITMEFTV